MTPQVKHFDIQAVLCFFAEQGRDWREEKTSREMWRSELCTRNIQEVEPTRGKRVNKTEKN